MTQEKKRQKLSGVHKINFIWGNNNFFAQKIIRGSFIDHAYTKIIPDIDYSNYRKPKKLFQVQIQCVILIMTGLQNSVNFFLEEPFEPQFLWFEWAHGKRTDTRTYGKKQQK